jgi:hypothetical protein
MRQFFAHSQALAQIRAGRQQVQHPAVGGLEISPHDQTTHQLALGEIVAAARGAVVSQMSGTQLHGQFGHSLHQRLGFLRCFHALLDTFAPSPFKKGFYKASPFLMSKITLLPFRSLCAF